MFLADFDAANEFDVSYRRADDRKHPVDRQQNRERDPILHQLPGAHGSTDWAIENSLHWVMDMVFRDEDCRVRAGNATACDDEYLVSLATA